MIIIINIITIIIIIIIIISIINMYSYVTFLPDPLGPSQVTRTAAQVAPLGIHQRGVQWEGGAVDWGSIIQQTSI